MVKLGFIVEGATEKIILEQSDFFHYLKSLSIQYIPEVVDAKGSGNLLPRNIEKYTQILTDKGATKIVILTDLDRDECITNTKIRIDPDSNHIVIVSVKEIESWFLADTAAISKFLNDTTFTFYDPETIRNPFEEIKLLRISKCNRGISDKKILAKIMVHKMNFSIQNAAQHEYCNSAKYFLATINKIASGL